MSKNEKRIKYVRIDDRNKSAASERGKLNGMQKVGKSLAVISTTLVCMLLVVIITVCIVATGLTIYVMQFSDSSFDIDLEDVELSFSSFICAKGADGQTVTIKQLNSDENRVWVDIEDIPQHVLDAVVSVEDARFFEHDGVDWKRTIAVSFAAVFKGGTDGGSTITQQLVRDITNDNDVNVGRKLREIFRAMALEKKYTKLDILESYLNRISFGGTSYGIASASLRYFGKDVSELTVAEGAILAGVIRSPSNFNPYADLKLSKERQTYALSKMYEYGYINTSEYESALSEQVKFAQPVLGSDYGYVDERYNEYYGIQDEDDTDLYYENETWEEVNGEASSDSEPYKWNGTYEVTQNWYVDAGINQVITDLAEMKGITSDAARDLLYNGGFTVYLNMDIAMQDKLSALFEDPLISVKSVNTLADRKNSLQAAFVISDYSGKVLAIAGGLGEKEGDNCFNRATQAKQVIGSTIKPLSVYSLALENNVITYSTMIRNISGKIPAEALGVDVTDEYYGYDAADQTIRWPHNYQDETFGDGNYYPAWYGVEKSVNTMAVNILSRVGLQNAYTQLTSKLGFDTLDSTNDMAFSPLALGAFTNGLQLYKLAAAYAIFGNGGLYYEPYFYSQVLDSDGKVVLEQNTVGNQVISSEAAWITNRMMKTVITDADGSGQNAQLPNIEVIGKTGTANDMSALLFCGMTPSYVGSYRTSFDDNHEVQKTDGWRTVATVWHDVMAEVCDTSTVQNFVADPDVIVTNYCTETGLIATSKCPSTKVGYYRESNMPASCDSAHDKTYWQLHKDETIPFYG